MTPNLAVRQNLTLSPDPSRVVVKLFVPGEDAAVARTRAQALIDRVARLDDEETGRLLRDTLHRFGGRHRDLAGTFQHHYDLVRHRAPRARDLSPTTRLLVGAYFSHEYAVESAALCNPSMVVHPDQDGLEPGQLRVAISLRQIGEGHLSSIGFASAVLGPDDRLVVAGRPGPLVVGQQVAVRRRRDLLAAGLAEDDCDNEVSATVLDSLPERYDEATFERTLAGLPPDLLSRGSAPGIVEQLRRTNAASYAVAFPADTSLHQRVLWPATPAESNGMEDARFVRFVDESGPVYRATYTAYDGRRIATRALASRDLRRFEITPMRGPGARNKGVALFPRTVGGRHLALCRADGETIGLTCLDGDNRWQAPVQLHAPGRSWELIQVGNCGSPIETDAGWLVLTHGVGPMRRYAIGALLLDLDRPERVLAELPGALLAPDEAERDGYVPNVVYSCGGLVHSGLLWLPYGASDARVGFATVPVDALIAAMVELPPPPDGRRGSPAQRPPGDGSRV
ncbi:glycoside hydrolase family 130 protein [Micromonospora sp. NBC_01412]|uniref:glycoside hydrolase family 130 protein n=1 Tax=Micromonospora sp. NBC_01412 TaxID=2903590 RepID=UPI0032447230